MHARQSDMGASQPEKARTTTIRIGLQQGTGRLVWITGCTDISYCEPAGVWMSVSVRAVSLSRYIPRFRGIHTIYLRLPFSSRCLPFQVKHGNSRATRTIGLGGTYDFQDPQIVPGRRRFYPSSTTALYLWRAVEFPKFEIRSRMGMHNMGSVSGGARGGAAVFESR